MKSIGTQAIIEGIRSRKDGSLGITVSTPELRPEEKTLFFELQNLNVQMDITPLDVQETEKVSIDTDLQQKSQSQRMRDVLYVIWRQDPKNMTFETFYKQETEKIIDELKGRIN